MSAVDLASLTTTDVARLLSEAPLDVIVPLGAFEQHGAHLPLSTDLIIAEAVAAEAAEQVGSCAVGPCVAVGVSGHHLGFAGSASLSPAVMTAAQTEIVSSFLQHGFRYAYLVTGHAGNCGSMNEAVGQLSERYGRRVASFADWPAQRDAVHRAGVEMGFAPEMVGTHAGHFETSIMLLLRPDLVRMERAAPGHIGPARQASRILRSQGMKALSPSGVIGDPRGAHAAAGRRYLDALVDHVADGIAAHRDSGPLGDSATSETRRMRRVGAV